MTKRPPKPPPLTDEQIAELDEVLEATAPRWVGHLMRTQPRRAWLAPLLAVPLAQLIDTPVAPSLDLLTARERREGARLSAGVRRALERVGADRAASLTDDDAYAIVFCAEFIELAALLMPSQDAAADLLGMPRELSGEGLVRRLARAIDEHPEPPAWLALVSVTLLDGFQQSERPRDLLPTPDPFFAPVVQAFDRRCHALGFRTWSDALAHSSEVWTADRWRDLLVSFAAAAAKSGPVAPPSRKTAAPRSSATKTGPRQRAGSRQAREAARAQAEVAAARHEAEAARVETAAAQRREGELIQARDRARTRMAELEQRLAESTRALEAARAELAAREPAETSEPAQPATPAPIVPSSPAPDPEPLRDRLVFLFTGSERKVAVQDQEAALRSLGAAEVRIYDLKRGRPGPDVFPAGSVVVVDLRFAGHSDTEEIEWRARRSEGVRYVALPGGSGGLAARLAERLG